MSSKDKISEWFHLYSDDIYHFLIYRIGSADVEDLVQEVFIKAINGLETFKGNASPKTWLFSIARNVAIDEIRKNKWKKFISFDLIHEPKNLKTPETVFNENEATLELYMAVQSLKPSYRDVIILRGLKDLTVSEASFVLNWSENKVRSTYNRAKAALRKRMGGNLYES